jgi:hypothetical protein
MPRRTPENAYELSNAGLSDLDFRGAGPAAEGGWFGWDLPTIPTMP